MSGRAILLRWVVAMVVWACFGYPPSLHAETTTGDTLRSFGLLGVWSPDCHRAPSQSNPRVSFNVVGDTVMHAVAFDAQSVGLVDSVGTAEILDDETVRFSTVRNGVIALIVTARLHGNQLFALRSETPQGQVFYADGIELITGLPALVDERCGVLNS